jgi:hypothetical protein
MAKRRSSVLLLVLAGAGTAWLSLAATPAGSAPSAGTAQVLTSGAVTQIPSPGVALTTPVDGRLRGPDFQAEVTGVAWPAAVGTSPNRYVAGSGQRLVVFSLTLSQPVAEAGGDGPSGTTVTASVSPSAPEPGASVDLTSIDQQILDAAGDTGSGSGTFVVAVPAHSHSATLTVAESTFAQSFNLWTLVRNAPFPATDISFSQITPLSGGSPTFTAPGSPPVTATATSPIAPAQQDQGAQDDGLLDATYTFIVPASTSSGVLSIAPGVISGDETDNFSAGPTVPCRSTVRLISTCRSLRRSEPLLTSPNRSG